MLLHLDRARDFMRRCGLDALVAASWVNITYLTDYYNWIDPLFREYMMAPGASSSLGQGFAVLPLEGEPALIISPLNLVNAADLWVRDIVTFGAYGLDEAVPSAALTGEGPRLLATLTQPAVAASPVEALLHVLRSRGLADGRLGLDREGLTASASAALPSALPRAQVKDASNLFRLIRAVKCPEEIRRLERSAQINEDVGLETLALAGPGRSALDLVHHYRARVAALGTDYDHFSFSPWGMGITSEAAYNFAPGDIQFVDFGCLYGRYFSDTGMTLAVGDAAPAMLERHAALRAAMAAGMAAIGPGVRSSTVRGAMGQALRDNGVTASNPHGHGLGLEIRDYPILVPDNGLRLRDDCIDEPSDLPLEVDMVFNLESAIFTAGAGSVHIERTFVVTPGGCRPLVPQDRSGVIQR